MSVEQYEQILKAFLKLSGGGGTSSVDITGNTVGLATGANIATLQNTLNTTLGNLLTQLSAINGNTDLLETLQTNANTLATNTNNLLTLTNSYVDGVEGLLTALGNNTDNLEALLTALGLNTDDLENLITAGNALLTTIRNNQTNKTQFAKITDGTNDLVIRTGGQIDTWNNLPFGADRVTQTNPDSNGNYQTVIYRNGVTIVRTITLVFDAGGTVTSYTEA